MKIDLTKQQIDRILVYELEDRLALADDARLKMALQVVIKHVNEDNNDELQDIVSSTAC